MQRGCGWSLSETVYRYFSNPKGISQSGRKRPKCLDALYVHLSLYRDRQRLGLPDTQFYYRFILSMVALCYERTHLQPEDVQRAVFTVWADFFSKNFTSFHAGDALYSSLEKALRTGNYRLYRLCCPLM